MSFCLKVGSITNAERAMKLLRENGFKPYMKRHENPSGAEGCGYVVCVSSRQNLALALLRDNGITVYGVDKE